jgi:UMF1 family MFS transporter
VNRKHIVSWALYDFAGSIYSAVIAAAVFNVYFVNVIVGNESGRGDQVWGWVGSVSVAIVALTSPLLGAIADRAGVRKRLMIVYSSLGIASVASLVFLEPGMVWIGFALSVLMNLGFEGGQVFYNAYLPDIAPKSHQGRVSGWGFGLGYLGSALGLVMAIPLARSGRFDLLWLVVAAEQQLRRFLLAFFFYIDGVLTVIWFAAIFASGTLQFTQSEVIILFLVVQISALLGSFAMAKPTDVIGPKRIILAMLVLWSVVAVSAYFITSKGMFFAVAVLAGTGLGSIQSASRSFMSALIPEGKEGEMFGFYAFCGKSSSILGPIVFGTVSRATGGNQRIAVVAIAAFFIVGGILLTRVRDPMTDAAAPAGVRAAGT